MSSKLAVLQDQFASFCRIRTPTVGRIVGDKFLNITSSWSFRSPNMKKNLKVHQYAMVNAADLSVVSCVNSSLSESESQAIAHSPDGSTSAIFNIVTEGKDKKYYLRIVDVARNVDSNIFNLTAKKVHGAVHFSGDFGGAVFSPSGKYLLYTAERLFKPVDFLDAELSKPEDEKDKESKKKNERIGDKYIWQESYGEQTVEVVDPVLCLLTIETGEIKVLDSIPRHFHPVSKLFSPDEKAVIFSALDAPHYKLGKIFCSNRVYLIGKVSIQSNEFEKVAEKLVGVDTIKMSSEGVLFAVARANGHHSHQGSYAIYKINVETSSVEKLNTEEFFMPLLSERVFTNNGRLVFTGIVACSLRIFSLNLANNKLEILSPSDVSDTVLDVYQNYILIQRSSATRTPELWLAKILDGGEIQWLQVSKSNGYEVQHECIDVAFHENFGPHSFLLMPKSAPKEDSTVPLVVVLHGGPHGSSFKTWPRRTVLLLLQAGFGILQINYPGSIGYDDNYVQQLPGKVGTLDVEFCENTIADTLSKIKQLDSERVAIMGGSHGGFLVSHLAGKSPEKYKAVVALNPVLNIRTMFDITDIPDWCAFETYSKPLPTGPMAGEVQAEMVAKSPIVNAHRIRSPFLLCIGGKDLRVPPHFRTFVRELSVNGVIHKVLYYPESNHALDEVEVETDVVLNSVLWIKEHVLKECA